MKKEAPTGYDFAGYVTKFNVLCQDGTTILNSAFAHHDGEKIPLMWHHLHDNPRNVVGHVVIEHRDDGDYGYGFFNNTEDAKHCKEIVAHGDINSLSVYANRLVHNAGKISKGFLREVSLCISGKNTQAKIDKLAIQHADGSTINSEDEAIMYFNDIMHAETFTETEAEKIMNSLTDMERDAMLYFATIDSDIIPDSEEMQKYQQTLLNLSTEKEPFVYAMIEYLREENDLDSLQDTMDDLLENLEELSNFSEEDIKHSDIEKGDGILMKENLFDQKKQTATQKNIITISHADMETIVSDAKDKGVTLKTAFNAFLKNKQADLEIKHADYGFEDMGVLYPDYENISTEPFIYNIKSTWVSSVLNDCMHSPYGRLKMLVADITADEARAKGYVTGAEKDEDVYTLLKRTVDPTTVYTKQKIDNDDVIDITDFSVLSFTKKIMRMKHDEERARAILVGDGRLVSSPDKIKETHIIPVYKDADLYSHKVLMPSSVDAGDLVDAIIRNRQYYRGSGNPSLYATGDVIADMLLIKDTLKRRLYGTLEELKAALRVDDIIEVPPMEGLKRTVDTKEYGLKAMLVNLNDYTIGAVKGGKMALFNGFDLDFNQHKFLLESRTCGALTIPKSALIFEQEITAG